jgi:uncharacterized protein (DUF302 family)
MDLYEEMFAEMQERTKNTGIPVVVEKTPKEILEQQGKEEALKIQHKMNYSSNLYK